MFPTYNDYVTLLKRLFDIYQNTNEYRKKGRPFIYSQAGIIIFFIMMIFRCIHHFKSQHRWLERHREMIPLFDWQDIPHRTTLSRRYKALYPIIQDFLQFLGIWAENLDPHFNGRELFEDKSLFKACGPVWHSKDRKKDEVPQGLRNLDKDASWSKSEHHGWVYGYGLHLTAGEVGFPVDVIVETASVSESKVMNEKESFIFQRKPVSVTADSAYCKLARITAWARKGIALITPAKKLKENRSESANYKQFVRESENKELLKIRKTAVEPAFDLISKVLGLGNNQKQLPIRGIKNVQTLLAMGTFIVQFTMIINSIWVLPIREIAHIAAVFT